MTGESLFNESKVLKHPVLASDIPKLKHALFVKGSENLPAKIPFHVEFKKKAVQGGLKVSCEIRLIKGIV